ncbi:MAG TPA: DUF2071 domain-containing protein [Candidatus Sulfopaludibacter sp.]|jgi:hypothetical protein|nr:DUF2071 domain-containing protein [Candidatus Sulfopaludibacter sp.]
MKPALNQAWQDLTFLHWPLAPQAVRRLVPAGLELDLWDGAAWVALVPFAIENLTHPRLPPVPWLSHFLETNVRTYVVDRQGRRGVWFFSLDAARLAAVAGARAAYALPYFWSRMRLERDGERVRYRGRRISPRSPGYEIEVRIGERIGEPSPLEVFLTARYRLYSCRAGKLRSAEVEHAPWPLQRAEVVSLRENLIEAAGLPAPEGLPLVHFSERVEVRAGWPEPF